MQHKMAIFGFSAILLASCAAAADLNAAAGKRQVGDCMTRRMAADRGLSYNAAMKVCKDQAALAKIDPATTPTVADNSKAH